MRSVALLRVLHLPILALFGTAAFLYFRFTAEDAFITYRYAENLVTLGAFVFNEGEPILALTSPLHGLVSSVLFLVTGQTVLANKILGLALLLGASGMVWLRYADRPLLQPLVAALILLPPSVVLWTFGGLETPLLLLFVTSATLVAARPGAPGRGRLCLLFLLAGLAFLTRFDSVLFVAPLVLYAALRARDVRDVALATVVGAALPTAWLVISQAYYGDILPTSFYAKTPVWRSVPVLIGNGKYVLFHLVLVGLLPALLLALALMRRWSTMFEIVWRHFRTRWWLYLAIAAQLLYGLTMAQTHMMFSFRYFVPYIPAFTILVADLTGHALDARPWTVTRRASVVGLAIMALLLFQAFQIRHTWRESVHGLSRWGEYRSTGVRQYIGFIDTLQRQGHDIREHWRTVAEGSRRPRIFTYAAGVVPWTFRDSYVYETLVSYRHCVGDEGLVEALNVWMRTPVDLRASADYIHVLTPRHGPVAPQLPLPEEHFGLISSHRTEFDGQQESFLVFYNPSPAPHTLPSTIDGLCGPGGA